MEAERIVAHHEAGHLFAAYRLRIPFSGRNVITIIPSEDYSGVFKHKNILRGVDLEWDGSNRSRMKMERVVQVCLAGIEAQRQYDPSSIRYGESPRDWDGGDDYHRALDLIDHFVSGPRETEAYLVLLRIRAESLVQTPINWECIQRVAEFLAKEKMLSGKRAIEIIQTTIRGYGTPTLKLE